MNRSEGLITNLGSRSPITEAYRSLRTNLEFVNPDSPAKTILFTSSGPGEGKSTTAANLAISSVQNGKRVLLIDCDLRKPVQHSIFSISNMKGITDLLVDHSITLDMVMQETNIPNLKVIPCGTLPPNPAELLGSQRMTNLIKELLGYYDMLVIDAPPIISVTDAAILASIADGVILVVRSGQAERGMVIKANELLKKVNAKVLGVVMNRIKIDKNQEQYYYYYSKGEPHVG